MANDRDEKFEGHEESEYHFSDEEVSYEVEPEVSKQTQGGGGNLKQNIMARLTSSKRMLISLGVFLVLVFVVYKMVAPTSTAPSTAITTPPVAQNMPPKNLAPAQANQNVPPTAPAAQPQAAANVPASLPVAPAAPAAQPGLVSPVTAQTPAMQPANVAQVSSSAQPQTTIVPGVTTPATQPSAVAQSQQPVIIVPANQPAPVSMPAVIPVQSPAAPYAASQVGIPSSVDQQAANLAAENAKLMNQLQTQVNDQLNSYSTQNKAIQDQMQALSARVGVMENQLNQLIQALTRRGQGGSMANPAGAPAQAVEPKIAYNVQAIIPGRAWLKSENGETLTVAEGDMIKDFGRVTKIDPYDGIVEINTGTKAVSLSYGNGG
jgi:hypothetical protein